MATTLPVTDFIRWFEEVGLDDVPMVGGKNASLGEVYQELSRYGVKVPNGFTTTANAYRHFLNLTGLDERLKEILSGLDPNDIQDLRNRGKAARHAILEAEFPEGIRQAILESYQKLCDCGAEDCDVAVRSSATAEDLPEASFAGQQETYLNVRGASQLLDTCRRCMASLFTDRAISYREHHGFSHDEIALSIGVQKMVRSDLATSGVMFSIDTETGFKDAVLINAAYGLGENVVQGAVNPDEYYVFKPKLREGFRPIFKKTLGNKEFKLVYDTGGSKMTKNVPVSLDSRQRFALEDDEILKLANWACIIEDHYSNKHGRFCPMDIEWAKDGISGELFIVQARPETVKSQTRATKLERYELQQKGKKLVSGRAVGEKIGQGRVRVVDDVSRLLEFQEGEVLVTDKTDPDWEPVMKRASAIVTNRGGRTCHAAIVSRELGVPAIVGTNTATRDLHDGADVTVCCSEGETGVVYDGRLPFQVNSIELGSLSRPSTKVMLNIGSPDEALSHSLLPNDGVGLAREEFIITTYVKIHPLALLDYATLEPGLQNQIDEITAGYDDKVQFYIDKLSEGVATIAAAFYPKDVILRLSDFKSNEYANLVGGAAYEPKEENPMIGFRGASRYYDERYQRGFALECQAIKRVRDEMGLKNVKIMIPFCRTVEEGRRVQVELAKHGLERGKEDLEVYVMCEIPSNVILADSFAEIFDGFSIGSNDLTQLVLGVDRDSEIVAHVFDERNPAVMEMIRKVIRSAKKNGCKIGICGQAPSDYPEFTRFLVEEGIDSISLTPDVLLATTADIVEVEQKLNANLQPGN